MKLLVDILSCQTPSRYRGIGRYTLSLMLEMAHLRGSNEMSVLANAHYAESLEYLRQQFIRLLPAGSFLSYYHESVSNRSWDNADNYFKLAEATIEHAYQVVSPDVVLTPSLFEGWGGGEHGTVPLPDKNYLNQKRVAILYDIIPYIFQNQYLDPNPVIKEWYLERIGILQNFDLLLAISEATRQDAINILGLNPNKVVNISGAASSHFKKMHLTEEQKQHYLQRVGISRPFVLYIGGNDFRKNMDGAIGAYAKLPREIVTTHQLVLNDVGDEIDFRRKACKLGLDVEDLVIINKISDEELVILYNLCKLFIFPSLYEGFGLPVLEAMSCGTPTIVSDASPDIGIQQFERGSVESLHQILLKTISSEKRLEELSRQALSISQNYKWERTVEQTFSFLQKFI